MEYEIEDLDVLFDRSTNPSLVRRASPAGAPQKPRLYSWNRAKPCQKGVVIPEEENQLA